MGQWWCCEFSGRRRHQAAIQRDLQDKDLSLVGSFCKLGLLMQGQADCDPSVYWWFGALLGFHRTSSVLAPVLGVWVPDIPKLVALSLLCTNPLGHEGQFIVAVTQDEVTSRVKNGLNDQGLRHDRKVPSLEEVMDTTPSAAPMSPSGLLVASPQALARVQGILGRPEGNVDALLKPDILSHDQSGLRRGQLYLNSKSPPGIASQQQSAQWAVANAERLRRESGALLSPPFKLDSPLTPQAKLAAASNPYSSLQGEDTEARMRRDHMLQLEALRDQLTNEAQVKLAMQESYR